MNLKSFSHKLNMKLATFLLLLLANVSMAQSTSWWNDAVFYEVFVRSFKDDNGDGKGDLKGLISKLDYLNDGDTATHNDLGVTAIWLMPIQESPSYHGYDVTDYRSVEQDYGTSQDFTDFINAAHARGIKVIIDYVMNHSSSQHPWFIESTNPLSDKRNWYVWSNTNPGILGPWGQQVWHSRNGAYNYGIFWSEMPDLNYNTPEVKTEIFDAARFWLEDMNVDGFRLDAIKYIKENGNTLEDTPETIQFWKDFRTHYKSIDANALAVGEAWTSTDKVAPYVGTDGLDFCFEFDLATAILNAANNTAAAALQAQMDEVIAAYPQSQYGTFLTNHDMNRTVTQLGNSSTKAKVAADLLLTLPGVPYIYYGEEIGMIGSGADENKRTPMQWNATAQAGFTTGTPWRVVNGDYTTKNVSAQQQLSTSLWNKYRNLIAIRNNQEILRKGTYKSVTASSATVFSFLRQFDDQHILVVTNTGVAVSNVQLTALTAGIAEGNYTMVELQTGTQYSISIDNTGGFTNYTIADIPARTTLILKLLDPSKTTASVKFEVDMRALITSGDFIAATETVDVVASFNNYGIDYTSTLSDPELDGIYSAVIPGLNIGSTVSYKYRINATNDERTEFSGSAYLRTYMVLEGLTKVKDVYQLPIISGVKNPAEQHAFAVYPVPSNKEIFIEYPHNFSGAIQYRITDLTGMEKAASSFSPSTGEEKLSCENIPSGVYLLTLEHNGTREVFKIVLQK